MAGVIRFELMMTISKTVALGQLGDTPTLINSARIRDTYIMQISNIYIISWFGEDPTLIDRRRKIHQTQLDWCKKHNLHPVVFAQNYAESDYVDGVTYIKHTGPVIYPGPARNQLLKHFYKTNDDYAVFADNDGILYEDTQHGDSANFVELLRSSSTEDFASIDLINPADPARLAFTKELASAVYRDHLVFRKTNKVKGTIFFLKNVLKHKETELYFDETIFDSGTNLIPGEDLEFGVAATMQGLGVYYTYNAILNELARNESTWAESNSNRNSVPTYNLINNKYHCELFNIPDDVVKKYEYVGYSLLRGKYDIRLAVDQEQRRKVLAKNHHTDIQFYRIPLSTVADAVQYALKNIDDVKLRDLIEEQIRQNKTHINRGKQRTQFNWNLVPLTIPLLPDKVLIKKLGAP